MRLAQLPPLALAMWFCSTHATESSQENLLSLSLAELANVKVTTGSLFSGTAKEAPHAITIINRQQINLSGAKDLANLLEQQVPGLILMTHSEGSKIGLRGHIAAENYKLLLLVNGKNITNMVYEGVITEIDQWELDDIQQIEVIHGPGSVTYGTGAIAGVINIITKTAKDSLSTWSSRVTRNDTYNSNGFNLQFAKAVNDWDIYSFISYRNTNGLKSPDYFTLNPNEPSDNRYIGKWETANAPPQEFLADSFDRPQIKAHLDISRNDNFKTWLRYTQAGQTRSFSEKSYPLDSNGNELNAINGRNIETRSLVLSSDYRLNLSDDSSLKTALTLDSQEYIRYRFDNREYAADSISNVRQYAFSQDRLTLSSLYDFIPHKKLKVITGYEYSNIHVGAPWGKSIDHLWIKEGVDIISNLETSTYLQDASLIRRPNTNNAVEVGSNMKFETHTHLLESQFTFNSNNKLLYAHRLDYPDISDSMFSPRLTLISKFNKNNSLTSTLQRAQRMMPLRAQYLAHQANNSSKHETLDSIEFAFSNRSLDNTHINLRAYYNDIRAVGFTGERLEFLTDFKLFGLELSGTYTHGNTEISLNHTFLEPFDIDMNDELKTGASRNNISFSDYYYHTRGSVPILLTGYGGGLNNWPSNITKFLYTQSFPKYQLTLHINAQINWDYDGAYDEMGMYMQAYDNLDRTTLSPEEIEIFNQQYEDLQREKMLLERDDGYKTDYNLNVSVIYSLPINNNTKAEFKFFAENLLKSSKRYYVSTGSTAYYPSRLKYLEKPRIFGLSVQASFY